MDKLTEEEFTAMLSLIKRYTETEMDQWQAWKFDTDFGNVFIEVTRDQRGSTDTYTDVSDLLTQHETNKGQ